MPSRFTPLAFLILLALHRPVVGSGPSIQEQHELNNLATFARVYGYVRFFYPGDAAANLDWDRLAMVGLEQIRAAPDADALRAQLLDVFAPIAPDLRITLSQPENAIASVTKPATFWQYQGINLSPDRSAYRQRRVLTGASLLERQPLFEPAEPPHPLVREIGSSLWIEMPLALPVGDDGRTVSYERRDLAEITARLDAVDLQAVSPADWRMRLAGVTVVWNVFQHFHPYLDQSDIDWSAALLPALEEALRANDASSYNEALSALVAKSNDGHGYVYGPGRAGAGLPLRFAWINDELIISGVDGEEALRKGDVVEMLDGCPARQVLAEVERRSPGSPHLRRFRALNTLGEGPPDSASTLTVRRGSERLKVDVRREKFARGYFFKAIPEFALPGFAEIRPGIYHINLYEISPEEFESKKDLLRSARGIIFDWRFSGERKPRPEGLQPTRDILPHLIDEPIYASPMLIPQIMQPDRTGWSYRESTWPVQPKAPRLLAPVVFINEPSVVSYGETCMAMITHYRLATLVGAPTAGCNGNAAFIPLPGGYRVMWTGMDVLKHDRTPFYDVGFHPNIPVERTVEGIATGRDEYVEAAVTFIESHGAPSSY